MKRAVSNLHGNGDERPAKLQRRDSPSTVPIPSNRQQEEQITAQPLSPLSNNINTKQTGKQERGHSTIPPRSKSTNKRIFDWIPPPSEEFYDADVMDQPASKRSRSRSISTDRGRPRSTSSDTTSSRDHKSSAYKDPNYVTILETKGCFMRPSEAGPVLEDIELCRRLLQQPIENPQGTLLDDNFIEDFYNSLRNRSEARLLVDLHPHLMPSAENQYIQGRRWLKNVIDGYNDPWLKTEPIHGPRPQPDHARGLKWSTFSEQQRRKLGIKPAEKSLYIARDDMYFPYLTAEIKCGTQALEFADRQNMHSMCIALRAVVSLSQIASCPEKVHRRILAFSISHELDGLRIYGYYPEITDGRIEYFRWKVAQIDIWSREDKWTCYRFVENLDREFLPIHIDRLMDLLAEIPEPQDFSFEIDNDHDIASGVGSQEWSGYSRAPSSQNLQPELCSMIQVLQQQLEEQKTRLEEQKSREEEQKAREEEQKAREEKLLAKLEQQAAEQKVREEQQRLREERLLKLLEQRQ
ncbi:uncharacterized protein TRUGW13939_10814 [Talaromyces rugulosus]|uniref:DUF7924 domain-containing protein n=1 Tax=Talaromyces rugulosus TaxID=121627 RepID=A0A7H8RGE1_TALRU|nr:uncharacterized protein TRUGW13939_10814 [Talaromyces rugulosus]QKX63643.1 hypothetical protein TRUGW13939_10814 [Talaromyces rugulosus]